MITKEFLEKEYVKKQRSLADIAKDLGSCKKTLSKYCKEFEIPLRRAGRIKVDLKNKKFGKLLVLEEVESKDKKHPTWSCLCDCGQITTRVTSDLISANKNKMCWDCRNQFISTSKWKGYGEISGEFWDRAKRSAKVRKIDFQITIEDAWQLFLKQNRKCALSKKDIGFHRNIIENTTASIDRIDSSIGYVLDNIQWVHKTINNLKMDLNQIEFIEWCRLVATNN